MTTLMFENFPMNVLHLLILFKVINIKELNSDGNQKTLIVGIASTFANIVNTLVHTYMFSSALEESFITYMMTQLTASNNWVPFIQKFMVNKINNCIDYSEILVALPFFSNSLGFYLKLDYQFSDQTLNVLVNEMNNLVKRMDLKEKEDLAAQKFEFFWSNDCLKFVTLNNLVHFYINLPPDIFIYHF